MSNEVLTQYKRYRARNRRFISAMVLLLAVTGIVSLIIGSHRIGWQELWAIVQNEGTEMNRQILLNIRLPRMLAAVITGIILSLSGAIMQILLRNPLASPYTLGISNAAAFGASFGIVFLGAGAGITRSSDLFMIINPYVITLSAFLGSLLGLAIILIIIRGKQASVETIILSGVIINSLFGAGIAVMQYVANNVQLASIVFWNFGDLGRSDWSKLLFLIVALIPALIYFYLKRWDYKVLCSGDDYAQSMGVNIKIFRVTLILLSSVLSATVTAFAGPISFVGIAVPHLVKQALNTSRPLIVVPGTFLGGAVFCMLSDLIARTAFAPLELNISTVTSIFGAPVVIAMMLKRQKGKQ